MATETLLRHEGPRPGHQIIISAESPPHTAKLPIGHDATQRPWCSVVPAAHCTHAVALLQATQLREHSEHVPAMLSANVPTGHDATG